jgi:phosphate-selective porin
MSSRSTQKDYPSTRKTFTSLPALLALCVGLTALPGRVAQAGPDQGVSTSTTTVQKAEQTDQSIFDKIWALPKIYRNDDNPVIEEFDLIGRFQEDFFNVDSKQGRTNYWEIRRFRLGADAFFAERHLELKAELDTNLHSYKTKAYFYNRFTNLYAAINVSDAFNIRFGKFEPRFGYDREFSDTLQKFFERSFFDDQIIGSNDYVPGAEVTGKFGHFGYRGAMYSTDVNKEFGNFHGGQAFQAQISYDFAPALHADKALWTLDYLHADGKNIHTNVFANYRDAAATFLDFEKQRFSLVTQVGYGHQISNKGDIVHFQIMPGYKITDKLEAILRYQYATGSQPNALSTLNRQVKTVGVFSGDTYNALYAGLDYYVYGHKLKFMFGEEYARLAGGTGTQGNYEGWTTWVGFRLFF